jgi:hypothetical protein
MHRNPLILHLYDKPHCRRSYSCNPTPSASVGSAVLACATIAVCVGVFFWVYDAIVHRGPPFVPVLAQEITAGPRSAVAATKLIPPEALAPDLHSPAVMFANADVPPDPEGVAAKEPGTATPEQPKKAAPPPTKKQVRAAKRLSPEAAQSFASAPGFFRVPFGGF